MNDLEIFLDREHEITSYPERPPHGNWPDEWDEKPFARIKWAEDSGDSSVGMLGWRGFCLCEDQSGTVLGDLLKGDDNE